MTGTAVITSTEIIQWMGILFGSWGIGFASGVLYRTFRRVLEISAGG